MTLILWGYVYKAFLSLGARKLAEYVWKRFITTRGSGEDREEQTT
jgi:hypothetical protein